MPRKDGTPTVREKIAFAEKELRELCERTRVQNYSRLMKEIGDRRPTYNQSRLSLLWEFIERVQHKAQEQGIDYMTGERHDRPSEQ